MRFALSQQSTENTVLSKTFLEYASNPAALFLSRQYTIERDEMGNDINSRHRILSYSEHKVEKWKKQRSR